MTTRNWLLCAAALALLLAPRWAAAQQDAGAEDALFEDSGDEDAAALADAAMPDGAMPDGAMPDGAMPDSSLPDSSLPDTLAPDAAEGCGAVSYIGECAGSTVRYCTGVEVVVIDCVAQYGASATCGLLDCTDQASGCYGYFCVTRGGEACGGASPLPCDAAFDQGCVDGLCTSSSSCDPATFAPRCDGDRIEDCTHTVNSRDCSEGGSQPRTCGTTAGGAAACVGLAGDSCGADTGRECQQGLSCSSGVCESPLADAGAGQDSGDGDGGGDGGCLCAGAGQAGPLLLVAGGLLLVAAAMRRRRLGRA